MYISSPYFNAYKGVFLCVLFILVSMPLRSMAAYYIVPKAEVPVRSGQGREYKIIAVLKEGAEVDLVEEDGPWTKIRLKSGKEGWILSRYLSPERPARMLLKAQQAKMKALEEKLARAQRRLSTLEANFKECEQGREACLAQKDNITNRYNLLLEDSKNIVNLKTKYEKQGLEVQKLKKELTLLRQENSDLKKDQNIRWFMAGGGVLLLGWLIGFSLGKRGRRRSSSLL